MHSERQIGPRAISVIEGFGAVWSGTLGAQERDSGPKRVLVWIRLTECTDVRPFDEQGGPKWTVKAAPAEQPLSHMGLIAEVLRTPALLLSWSAEPTEFTALGRTASVTFVMAAMVLVAANLLALFFADRINRTLLFVLVVLSAVATGGVGVIALTELATLWLSLLGCGFAIFLTTSVVRASVRSQSGKPA